MAFSFSPATEADEQALLDYLPANPQTPEELPDTIPADLFNVVGEYSIDGQVVASSTTLSFGQELKTHNQRGQTRLINVFRVDSSCKCTTRIF